MPSSQFNLAYIPTEDRLLMQLNADDKEQFQFLLTRRLTMQLMDGFDQVLDQTNLLQSEQTRHLKSPQATEAIKQFEHTGAVEKADFDTPFSEAAKQQPLGEKAILLHTIQLTVVNEEQINLRLLIGEDQSLDIQLTTESVHALYHIFAQSIKSAEWDTSYTSNMMLDDTKPNTPMN